MSNELHFRFSHIFQGDKMRLAATIVLMLVSALALGAPFVVSDPLVAGVQCGIFLDAAPKVTIPVTAVTTPVPGNICKFDIGGVSAGNHTISMTAITVNDPIWGSQESVKSTPLLFTRPAVPTAPTNLQLTP